MQQQPLEGFTKPSHSTRNVFSLDREIEQPVFTNIDGLKLDQRQRMDGLSLLAKVQTETIPLVFFDPQYRTILDRQKYGNEGKNRGKERASLP
ncbi:MAG TPA: hypothetical protein VF982_06965, partial [Anaerolineales bacterium]